MATTPNTGRQSAEDLFFFQYSQLPDALKNEVLDFIGYLSAKHKLAAQPQSKPIFGSAKGKYKMADDFDAL